MSWVNSVHRQFLPHGLSSPPAPDPRRGPRNPRRATVPHQSHPRLSCYEIDGSGRVLTGQNYWGVNNFATLRPFPRLQPPCLTGPLLGSGAPLPIFVSRGRAHLSLGVNPLPHRQKSRVNRWGTVARLGFLGPLLGSGAPCSWPGGVIPRAKDEGRGLVHLWDSLGPFTAVIHLPVLSSVQG